MSSTESAPGTPAPRSNRLSQLGLILLEAVPSFIRRFLPAEAPAAVALLTASQAAAVELANLSRPASEAPPNPPRARVHLERIRREFELFLRQRGALPWAKDDPAALKVRAVGRSRPGQPAPPPRLEDYAPWLDSPDAVNVANALICLTHQACYLAETPTEPPPSCPVCGNAMALRTVREGPRAGSRFWGCTSFPTCRGTKRHKPQNAEGQKKAADEDPRP